MVTVKILIDESKLTNLGEQIPKVKEKGLELSSQYMINRLQKNSPVDHGVLKGWFAYDYAPGEEVKIRSPAEYVHFVNYGTGIYNGGSIIKPKNGKFLVFKPGKKWKGPVSKKGLVFLRSSKGQEGQHFVEKSIDEVSEKLGGLFIKAVREVLK